MSTNMTGFSLFSEIFVALCFGRKYHQHWNLDVLTVYDKFLFILLFQVTDEDSSLEQQTQLVQQQQQQPLQQIMQQLPLGMAGAGFIIQNQFGQQIQVAHLFKPFMLSVPLDIVVLSTVTWTFRIILQNIEEYGWGPGSARRSNSHFKISQVWYPAHFHYAQKPSEHRESAQGASI